MHETDRWQHQVSEPAGYINKSGQQRLNVKPKMTG